MMEERSFHPLDYLSVLRRRKRWFVVPFVSALVLGALAVLFLPKQYESKATIAVAAPTLSVNSSGKRSAGRSSTPLALRQTSRTRWRMSIARCDGALVGI